MSDVIVICLCLCWAGFGANLVLLILSLGHRRFVRRHPSRGVGTWRRTGYALLPYQCTACGVYEESTSQYCPHCGRPMRLEDADGKE